MRIAILHESWLTHPDVGADEVAVLAALALHANRNGTCFPTQGLLASLLGRSRPWVNRIIAKLVTLGLVDRTHRVRDDGGDRACLYRLIGPAGDAPASATDVKNTVPTEAAISHPVDTASQIPDTPSHRDDSVKTESEHKLETHTATVDPNMINFDLQVPPPDWQPTDDDLLYALERFPEVDVIAATERFVNRCRAKQYRYRCLSAAWRCWLADDAKSGRLTGTAHRPGANRGSAAQTRFDAWGAVAARHAGGGTRHAAA